MVDFDQKVNITIEVDENLKQINDAAQRLTAVNKKIDGLGDSLKDLSGSFDEIDDSFESAGFINESEKLNEFAASLERVSEAKDEVSASNEMLQKENEDSSKSIGSEEKSLRELLDSAESAADAKVAVRDANHMLSKQIDKESLTALSKENEHVQALMSNMNSLNDLYRLAGLTKEEFAMANEETAETVDTENKAFHQLIEGGEKLSEVKDAARQSNKMLSRANREGAKSALLETDGWMQLVRAGYTLEEAMDELGIKQRDLGDGADTNKNKFRKLRNSLDETTDGMRAANKVGDLFEDGLGSLSVNLGAFTVALRNFLTQIPILLSALGTIGAAAGGVAGAFVTAGSAITAAIGAGAIGRAQDLNEQYEELEGLGESVQVIFGSMRDMMLDAIAPLTENEDTFEMFTNFFEGLAGFVNLVANAFNDLMPEIQGTFQELGKQLEGPLTDAVQAMSFMFLNLRDEMVAMTVGVVEAFADMTRFVTKFTNGLTSANTQLDVFTDALAELAQLGKTVLSGLGPIFGGFLAVIGDIASVLNQVNDNVLAAAVTFLAVFAAVNKFGGALGALISVVPNLIFGLRAADGSMLSMVSSMGNFVRGHGGMLTGLVSLVEALEEFNDEMVALAIRSEIAEGGLNGVDDEVRRLVENSLAGINSLDELEDELIELARSGKISEEQLEDTTRQIAQMSAAAKIAEDDIDDLSDANVSTDDMIDRKSRGGSIFVPTGTGGRLGKLKTRLTGILKKAVQPLISAVAKLAGGLGSVTTAAILLLGIGGILVGVLSNFDTVMSELGAGMSAVGDLMSWIGGQLGELFIGMWNSLHDIIVSVSMILQPIARMFGLTGDSASSAGGFISALAGTIEFLVDIVVLTMDIISSFIRVFATISSFIQKVTLAVLEFSSALGGFFVDNALKAIGMFEPMQEAIKTAENAFNDFMAVLKIMPSLMQRMLSIMVRAVQDGVNDMIGGMNDLIEMFNRVDGFQMDTFDTIDFGVSGGQGLRASEGELSAGTDSVIGAMTPEKSSTFNYEKYETQNVNQQIDADPEEKQSLSRVVKDAMEEADSFERRRQGFSG